MEEDRIVAIALLTEAQVGWLGASLKRVYRVEGTDRFDHLLSALDEIGSEQVITQHPLHG
jgi:hypothetical protein